MARKKKISKPLLIRQEPELVNAFKALRKLGIFRGDLRSRRATRKTVKRLQSFADLLNGNAVAIKAPKKTKELYGTQFRKAGGRLIIPTIGQEKVSIDKKTGAIKVKTDKYGFPLTSTIFPAHTDKSKIPHGKNITYNLRVYGHRSNHRFKRLEDLIDFLENRYDEEAADNTYIMVERRQPTPKKKAA